MLARSMYVSFQLHLPEEGMLISLQYNPFYVKYSPDENGYFDGQRGYGYLSLEKFIGASQAGHRNIVTELTT